jgi:hypothetical protein
VQYASLAYANKNSSNKNNNNVDDGGGDNNRAGIVFSLGRRAGNYHLSTDESVSREHCIIRIASTNEEHYFIPPPSPASNCDGDDDNHRTIAANSSSSSSSSTAGCNPMRAPRGSTIEKECQQARDQLCVVIENVGKLGTYIVQELDENDGTNKKDDKADKKGKDNSTSSDSETDDEMPVMSAATTATQQNSNGPRGFSSSTQTSMMMMAAAGISVEGQPSNVLLSPVSQHLIKTAQKKASVQPIVGINEMVMLHPLTLEQDNNGKKMNDHDSHRQQQSQLRHVIIQIGKLGSTIVITRMPTIYFFTSGSLAKSVIINTYQSQLYRIGAKLYSINNNENDNNNNNSNEKSQIDEFDARRLIQVDRVLPWQQKKDQGTYQQHHQDLKQFMMQYYSSTANCCYIYVTSQYGASIKQLVAWTCGIPIVAPSFIEALFNNLNNNNKIRTSNDNSDQQHQHQLVLPYPHEHVPKPDNFTFWTYETIQPNPLLWQGLTMISLHQFDDKSFHENDFDLKQLVQSAGADILSIQLPQDTFDSEKLVQYLKECLSGNASETIYFIVQQSAKALKYEKLVTSHPCLSIKKATMKQIAKCITTQSLLFPEVQQKQHEILDDKAKPTS